MENLTSMFSSLKIKNLSKVSNILNNYPHISYSSPKDISEKINVSELESNEIVEILKLNPAVYLLLNEKQKVDPKYYRLCLSNEEAVKKFPHEIFNKEICCNIVSKNGENIRYIPEQFKNDIEIIELAMENNLRCFKYLPEAYRNTLHLAVRACDIPENTEFICDEVKKKLYDCTRIKIILTSRRKSEKKRNPIRKSNNIFKNSNNVRKKLLF